MAANEEGANLERVTDFYDEDQISQAAPKEQLAEALSELEGSGEKGGKRADNKVASKMKLNSQSVALIMKELEVPKEMAEVALRESGGDVIGALKSLVWNR